MGHSLIFVETVLEGSVQVSGDRLSVTARLTDVDNGYQRWSDNYNQKIDDIFVVRDDIAQKIMNVLKIRLLGEKEKSTQLVKHSTENREAYNLYLRGRYSLCDQIRVSPNFLEKPAWKNKRREHFLRTLTSIQAAIYGP